MEKDVKLGLKGQEEGSVWKEREWGKAGHSLAFHWEGQGLGHS